MDLTEVLLEKGLTFDAVGITAEDERAIFEERKDVIGHAVIVGKKIAFGVAGFGEIDFVEIGDAETLAIDFENCVFGAALKELGFNLRSSGQDFANDGRGVDNVVGIRFRRRRRRNFKLPGAVFGLGIVAEGEKDGMAETVFVGPGGVADAGNEFRAHPGGFFIGVGRFGEGRAIGVERFEFAKEFLVRLRVEAAADMAGEAKPFPVVETQKK